MAVKVTVENPQILDKLLDKSLQAGLNAALNKAKELVEDKFTNNPSGWQPLAIFTIRERRALGFGPTPILYRTGRLKGQSVQQLIINGNVGEISTNDPIAIMQNNGMGRIPARPFYKLTDTDKTMIIQAFKAGLLGN
jgi:hypothetical protein